MLILACCFWWLAVPQFTQLERSFWLHASLDDRPSRGYWGPALPPSRSPTEEEVGNAALVLSGEYAASRLYLIYHREIPIDAAKRAFRLWRDVCPVDVEIVPTLVLKMYDAPQTPVFSEEELRNLTAFLRDTINPSQLAVYDVFPNRDQGEGLGILAAVFPTGLIRLGIQPEEELEPPFSGAVEDTWSALCLGTRNTDWENKGFGRDLLRGWIDRRNLHRLPIAWDLIAVAWDYSATERGEYPGYDDAEKNMPLPRGRNLLAAREILNSASGDCFAGFSSDLFILHANSLTGPHDGPEGSFYRTLKRGEIYNGYYREPFHEVVSIYRLLKAGQDPRTLLEASLTGEEPVGIGEQRKP